MPSQESTPLSAVDALEQHTPRREVRRALRHISLILGEPCLARREDDGAPVDPEPSPVLAAALEAAISERIGEHVEQGTEHLARRYYGDQTVDDWFRAEGWNPDEIRGEPLTPAAELLDAIDNLDAAIADREPDPAEQWKRFLDARIALGPDRVVCEFCRGEGHFGSDEDTMLPRICDECDGHGSRELPEVDRDFFRALA